MNETMTSEEDIAIQVAKQVLHCPVCGSQEVELKNVSASSVEGGIRITPISGQSLHCNKCGISSIV